MEDMKIRIAVLWLLFECGALLTGLLELYTPDFVAGLIAGEILGMQITPETILLMAIIILIPPIMAFLSLTLKDSINRWANMILAIVFALLGTYGLSHFLAQLSIWAILIWVYQTVAVALIVWYAYKWK